MKYLLETMISGIVFNFFYFLSNSILLQSNLSQVSIIFPKVILEIGLLISFASISKDSLLTVWNPLFFLNQSVWNKKEKRLDTSKFISSLIGHLIGISFYIHLSQLKFEALLSDRLELYPMNLLAGDNFSMFVLYSVLGIFGGFWLYEHDLNNEDKVTPNIICFPIISSILTILLGKGSINCGILLIGSFYNGTLSSQEGVILISLFFGMFIGRMLQEQNKNIHP